MWIIQHGRVELSVQRRAARRGRPNRLLGMQRPSLNKILKELEREGLVGVRYATTEAGELIEAVAV